MRFLLSTKKEPLEESIITRWSLEWSKRFLAPFPSREPYGFKNLLILRSMNFHQKRSKIFLGMRDEGVYIIGYDKNGTAIPEFSLSFQCKEY